jgi:NAD(P)-dependent dehydrogenase (short-subunit alcohol dehydrogenase family)
MTTYLITGANRGIGLEIVKQLRARGDTVIATTRTGADSDLAAMGARVVKLEVSDEDSIAALGTALASTPTVTPIDVLINNAGVGSEASTLKDQSFDELSRVFTVNAFAPILLAKACLPALRAGKRRVIMNVSSQLASIATNNGGSSYPYRGSKTALNQLTMCLANELRPENFCCVSVHPGWVRTDMGGPKAPMLPPDSARHLITLADRLTPSDSGKFLNYDGATMAW